MRRFPRFLLVPLAVVPAVAAIAHGCSGPNYESVCDWLAEPDNCLRVFHQDALANKNTSADNPTGDCRFPTTDGGSPTEASATSAGIANGEFLVMMGTRTMLATCVIYSGGTVTFNPPLNPDSFPPAPDAGPVMITLANSDSTTCGTATYSSPYSFSISINAVPPIDGGGSGGAGTGGTAPSDAGFGTFAEVNEPDASAFTVTCPSGETHLLNLDEISGSGSRCPALEGILPEASLQVFPGGIDVAGAVSFAIVYPPLDAGTPYVDGGTITPDRVVYFNCTIPAAAETCHDGVQDDFETDIDCGGPRIPSQSPCLTCPARCGVMQQCRCDADCEHGLWCAANPMSGMLQCVSPEPAAHFATCGWTNMPVACSDGGAGAGGGGTGGGGTGGSATDGGDGG